LEKNTILVLPKEAHLPCGRYASDGSGNQPPEQRLAVVPSCTDALKFSDTDIVGLLEWSLPPPWRTKFNLDGYIPRLHNRAKLIENCEAIERNAAHEERMPSLSEKSGKNNKKKRKTKMAQVNTQKVIVLITNIFTVVSTGKTRRTQPLTVSP
jgi:hypothetical protein